MTSCVRIFPLHSESRIETANILCYLLGLFLRHPYSEGIVLWGPNLMQIGLSESLIRLPIWRDQLDFPFGVLSPVSHGYENQWSSLPNLANARSTSLLPTFIQSVVYKVLIFPSSSMSFKIFLNCLANIFFPLFLKQENCSQGFQSAKQLDKGDRISFPRSPRDT